MENEMDNVPDAHIIQAWTTFRSDPDTHVTAQRIWRWVETNRPWIIPELLRQA